jgi:3'-phosphoadenosine 5'-phosphosulfate sulfotransferase (PAPS reductase)/FAD synthetase
MGKHTIDELHQWQALPLSVKIRMTKERIRNWINEFGEDGVYVSFSGGKDSTVLLDLVRKDYPEVKAVFVDVPTQYPELKKFAKTFDNLVILKPKISFAQVCEKYGFPMFSKEISECIADSRKYIRILTDRQTDRQTEIPFAYRIADLIGIDRRVDKGNRAFADLKMGNIPSEILKAPVRVKQLFGVKCEQFSSMYDRSKYLFMLNAPFEVSNQCCKVMKKHPMHQYHKDTGRVPFTAQMASESKLRSSQWIQNGCNGFDLKIPTSNPMAFWTEQDVLLYIKENNLPICSVYGEVVTDYESMGQCENQMSFADYGIFDNERPLLKTTGCQRTGCVLCGFGCHLEKESRFELLKQTHPKFHNLLYILKNNGVTYAEAIDWVNEHGGFNIKY